MGLDWSASGNDKNVQINWRPGGSGANVGDHHTFDFRISRNPGGANVLGSTNFSIQLVMANGDLSDSIKLCNYAKLDRSVGGFSPQTGTGVFRPLLQTVRVPLSAFTNADLT